HVREFLRDPVDHRHDLVAARDREPAAGTEIVLHVDHQQQVAVADLYLLRHDGFYARRTIAGTRCFTVGAPICCIMARSSMRNSSSTRSTPGWPNAPRPQMYGRPTHTAVAPMHSALTMSEPRRNPESTRIGMRPCTASTISGSASMVERPESSPRAPWLETPT